VEKWKKWKSGKGKWKVRWRVKWKVMRKASKCHVAAFELFTSGAYSFHFFHFFHF